MCNVYFVPSKSDIKVKISMEVMEYSYFTDILLFCVEIDTFITD